MNGRLIRANMKRSNPQQAFYIATQNTGGFIACNAWFALRQSSFSLMVSFLSSPKGEPRTMVMQERDVFTPLCPVGQRGVNQPSNLALIGKNTPTYPTLPNPSYSHRVLSGGNASGNFRKSGKDRRFGLAGRTCETGEVSPLCHSFIGTRKGLVKGQNKAKTQIAGAGGPWIASIAYRTTPRPAFQGPPVILFFQQPDANAGVATGNP
ncbi:hypothetical protein FHW16_000209 [Phyllobacterium myrsinacearum]|uniref:Uncharacterized protein n=1 Tax=Phyllobacterium myrsinacearum TaxID=28101 RepID=A0A839EJ48_9HYPH|nr:hypothetical protein [Phyllobacterium myrsinacearum]